MLSVLERVLPFFILVGAGLSLTRFKLLDGRMAQGLSAYVYWLGFPALLIHSLSRVGVPDGGLALGLLAFGVCALAVMALIAVGGRLAGWTRAERAGAALAGGLGNSAFLGLPIAAAVLGPEPARLAAGVVAIDFVLVAAVGVTLLGWAGGRSPWRALAAALGNPIVVAAAVGSGLALAGLTLPDLFDRAVAAAALSGSPVALVALGAALGLRGDSEAAPRAAPILVASLAKLILLPALTWWAVGLVGAPHAFRLGATLLAATPTAVNVFVQTRAYDVFARGGARTVALTTALSAATLAALALWLGGAV
ncbi:MAG: transporter [Caulobacter sp.]|nr:transporter [Caulobacter sp.]